MHSTKLVAFIAALMIWSLVEAGEFNRVLSIGDMAPAWKDLPGTDGKSHSLSEFKDQDAVVVVFTCASCEYSVDYEDRFNALARQYGGSNGKVGFVGICVNQIAADRLDKLTERAKKKKFEYPVLYDESQKIAKDFGAIWTPEYYVLNKERRIVYMGAMDDANDPSMVTKRFLEDAIVATLKGETPSVKETGARGCMVRWRANGVSGLVGWGVPTELLIPSKAGPFLPSYVTGAEAPIFPLDAATEKIVSCPFFRTAN